MIEEFVVSAVAPATSAGDDVVSLLKLTVVWAEEDGLAKGNGLQDVVDTYAEAATDISHVGVAVKL